MEENYKVKKMVEYPRVWKPVDHASKPNQQKLNGNGKLWIRIPGNKEEQEVFTLQNFKTKILKSFR